MEFSSTQSRWRAISKRCSSVTETNVPGGCWRIWEKKTAPPFSPSPDKDTHRHLPSPPPPTTSPASTGSPSPGRWEGDGRGDRGEVSGGGALRGQGVRFR